ncbi:DUF4199 domain-containing protein [Dokdonia sp. Asnod1-B02]|jgi:hypothetical protein|uniref:DUF4199 domain-containing protein n=1 Tax=Dokdonia sp. Asnod1-B02 TaxID=3160573 RepID=UPI0038704FE7
MSLVIKKFGMIAFFIGLLGFSLALYLGKSLDYGTQELVGWGVMGMTAAMVYFGVAYQRDTVYAGKISFGKALKTGIIIAALGGLGVALADIVYTLFVNPSFFIEYNDYAMELAVESKNPVAISQLKAQREMYSQYSGTEMSFIAGLMMFVMTFILGFVVSLIAAFILKKE